MPAPTGAEAGSPAASGGAGKDGGPSAEQLLLAVGRQVRLQRNKHKLTRRELGKRTDISERYLGEVEKGRANLSLGLLWRIADALGTPLASFMPADEHISRISPPLAKLVSRMSGHQQADLYRRLLRETGAGKTGAKGIALIGLRGAGKSTLGARLAASCSIPFIRLTEVIQELAGMETSELLDMMGPNAYRRIERQALDHIVERYPLCVMEAGGGVVREQETFNLLMQSYRVIWLKAAPEEHMQRVMDQGDLRPMSGNKQAMEELRLILKEREPYYSQADDVVDTSGRDIDHVFAELEAICRPYLKRR